MEILSQIGLFLAQALIIVLSIIAIIVTLSAVALKNKGQKQFEAEILNEKFDEQKLTLKELMLSEAELKAEKKALKEKAKEKEKIDKLKAKTKKSSDSNIPSSVNSNENTADTFVYLIDFLKGDVEASSVDHLKEEVNAILQVAQKNQEVILRVESPGGIVHGYGLAAAQILRLREAGLKVTICIDKVAASGGYLMACVAHQIISSPFAIIGSIGVVAQVPNFNRLLKKYDVDFKEYTAGDYKRTVSLLGEITEKGEAKFKEQLEATHVLFKNFVGQFRPQMDMAKIATGEYWYGQSALELKLVDKIQTSDDYILSKMSQAKVIKISCAKKPTISDKISDALSKAVALTLKKLASNNQSNAL